jgi:hypothetical protein
MSASFLEKLSSTSTTTILAWSAGGYFAYLALYRLFLSPVARVPGPKLAALSLWYECYYGKATFPIALAIRCARAFC